MEPEKKSYGALIGSIVVIIILIIGGLYIWQTKVKEMQLQKEQQEQLKAEALNSANDEINSLEEDLNATDTDLNVDIENIQ
mgnify:CR=1 FL=1